MNENSKKRAPSGYDIVRKELPDAEKKKLNAEAHELHPDDSKARKRYVNSKLHDNYLDRKEEVDAKVEILKKAHKDAKDAAKAEYDAKIGTRRR